MPPSSAHRSPTGIRVSPPSVFEVLPTGCRLWAGSREAARATVVRVLQGVESDDLAAGRRAAIDHAVTVLPKAEIVGDLVLEK